MKPPPPENKNIPSSAQFENKQQIAQRMADLIVEKVRAAGECTRDELRQAGFTEATIDRCYTLAQSLAAVTLGDKPITH